MLKKVFQLTFLFLFISPFFVSAQQWIPDSSYASSARAFFPFIQAGPFGSGSRSESVIQDDGKITLTGNGKEISTGTEGFTTIRFTSAGLPDPSFGNNGYVVSSITPYSHQALAIALQQDKKIIAGGWAAQANNEMAFALVRYLPDGKPDSLFGNNGIAINNFRDNEQENMQDFSLQADGKIIACGYTFETNSEIIVVRYTNKGLPDTSFNHTGYLFLSLTPSSYQAANCIISLRNGKMLVGGTYRNLSDASGYKSFLIRLNSNGSIDSSFGTNGQVYTSSSESFLELRERPDGKIIALGFRSIALFNSDGRPDNSFGSANGEITVTSSPVLRSFQTLSDGSLMLTGSAGPDFMLYKLKPNGLPDSSFGSNGVQNITAGNYRDRSYTLLQRGGRIYITGIAETQPGGNNRFTVLKMLPGKKNWVPFFRLFPIPVSTELFIESDTEIQAMNLYNAAGQLVGTWKGSQTSVQLGHLASGMYTLGILFTDGRIVYEKIIKGE